MDPSARGRAHAWRRHRRAFTQPRVPAHTHTFPSPPAGSDPPQPFMGSRRPHACLAATRARTPTRIPAVTAAPPPRVSVPPLPPHASPPLPPSPHPHAWVPSPHRPAPPRGGRSVSDAARTHWQRVSAPPPPHAAWIYLFFYFFLPVFVIFPPSLQRSRVGAPQRERTESSGRAIPAAPPPPPHGPPIGMGARSREGKWGVVPHGEGWGGTKGGTKGVPEGEPILGGGRSGGVSWGVLEGDPILRGFSWGCLGVGSYIGGGSWRGIPH